MMECSVAMEALGFEEEAFELIMASFVTDRRGSSLAIFPNAWYANLPPLLTSFELPFLLILSVTS